MTIQKSNFNFQSFNELDSIENADQYIQSRSLLLPTLEILGPIFLKYSMHNNWGVVLLHKHFSISENEIPIQEIIRQDEEVSLITMPKESFDKDCYPSVFTFNTTGNFLVEPLEFSTDELAKVANETLNDKQDFLQELNQVLRANNIVNVFGITCAKPKLKEDEQFVEYNFDDRVSILNIVQHKNINDKNLIETSWFFDSDSNSTSCRSTCRSICYVNTYGEHNGGQSHTGERFHY